MAAPPSAMAKIARTDRTCVLTSNESERFPVLGLLPPKLCLYNRLMITTDLFAPFVVLFTALGVIGSLGCFILLVFLAKRQKGISNMSTIFLSFFFLGSLFFATFSGQIKVVSSLVSSGASEK
jgi:hypothetical protein